MPERKAIEDKSNVSLIIKAMLFRASHGRFMKQLKARTTWNRLNSGKKLVLIKR